MKCRASRASCPKLKRPTGSGGRPHFPGCVPRGCVVIDGVYRLVDSYSELRLGKLTAKSKRCTKKKVSRKSKDPEELKGDIRHSRMVYPTEFMLTIYDQC